VTNTTTTPAPLTTTTAAPLTTTTAAPLTTTTTAPLDATPTPRTVAERQAADGLAACRAARVKRRDAATAPLAVVVPLAERFGAGATVAVVPRWRGAALCVHAPMRDGVPTPTRGVWTVTSTAYGYAAGTLPRTACRGRQACAPMGRRIRRGA
jgi:hypothetical protein